MRVPFVSSTAGGWLLATQTPSPRSLVAHTFYFDRRPDRPEVPGVEDEGGCRGRVPEARGGLVVVLVAGVQQPAQHERQRRGLPHLEHRRTRRCGRGPRATSGA